jgi:hypothetical protein
VKNPRRSGDFELPSWAEAVCRARGVTFEPSMLEVRHGIAYLSVSGTVVSVVDDEAAYLSSLGLRSLDEGV